MLTLTRPRVSAISTREIFLHTCLQLFHPENEVRIRDAERKLRTSKTHTKLVLQTWTDSRAVTIFLFQPAPGGILAFCPTQVLCFCRTAFVSAAISSCLSCTTFFSLFPTRHCNLQFLSTPHLLFVAFGPVLLPIILLPPLLLLLLQSCADA